MRAAAPTIPPLQTVPIEVLPSADRTAAEALAATMLGWDAAELEAYRSAVIEELSARGRGGLDGFLAVEVVALSAVEGLRAKSA